MEKKTMGSFLSALRKASGMTQKDLAELLHVSDKAVSRWERDECAPDLALIPVIAEIFGVTCDELLRGARANASEAEPNPNTTAKVEKQRQWILKKTLSQYKSRTLLAASASLLGLFAAVAATEGFYQRTLGFWLGAAFVLLGVVFQIVFWNSAWLSLSDETLDGITVGAWKYRILRLTEFSLGFSLFLLGVIWGYAGNGLTAWSRVLYSSPSPLHQLRLQPVLGNGHFEWWYLGAAVPGCMPFPQSAAPQKGRILPGGSPSPGAASQPSQEKPCCSGTFHAGRGDGSIPCGSHTFVDAGKDDAWHGLRPGGRICRYRGNTLVARRGASYSVRAPTAHYALFRRRNHTPYDEQLRKQYCHHQHQGQNRQQLYGAGSQNLLPAL